MKKTTKDTIAVSLMILFAFIVDPLMDAIINLLFNY